MDAQSAHAHAEEAEQQQQLQQAQPQHSDSSAVAASSAAGASAQDPASMQAQAAAQLQLQQMQWAAYLQAQQQFLAAQQAQLAAAGFNPQDAGGQVHAAAATSQYRSQYQHGYGAYPSQQDGTGEQQQQQQMQTLLPGGLLPPLLQQHQMLTSGYGGGGFVDLSGSSSLRRRDREKPAPSVDPNAWNDSITYPSKSNPDRYLAHRSYFSDVPPIVKSERKKKKQRTQRMSSRDTVEDDELTCSCACVFCLFPFLFRAVVSRASLN
jgi:hypothetical protein